MDDSRPSFDPGLLEALLERTPNAIGYAAGRAIAQVARGRAVFQVDDGGFDVARFLAEGRCSAVPRPELHHNRGAMWARRGALTLRDRAVWWRVHWESHDLDVIKLSWQNGYSGITVHWVVADESAVARAFATAVLDSAHVPARSVRVYSGSCWSLDDALWEAVQQATWDDLVLPGDVTERLRADVTSFLGARDLYARYRVPYKRGVLLTGPPGNGKTHCVRVLMKDAALPTLYVRSFEARYGEVDANIMAVFAEARRVAPCMVVLEDLDALVKAAQLSVFLNELDGIRADTGILTLATTNHPERLDPALLERPSRFDRKYHFDLPARAERERYMAMWRARLDDAMKPSEAAVVDLADGAEGFSYAYLKELVVSSMARWMVDPGRASMDEVIRAELEHLRAQVARVAEAPRPSPRPDPGEP